MTKSNTGWTHGPANHPAGPDLPGAKIGGPQERSVVRHAPADPKHIAHASYRVGQPAPGRTNTQMECVFHGIVSADSRRS